MVPHHGFGPAYRAVAQSVDILATHEPDRTWVSVPRDNSDLSKGFKDLNFRQFAQLVNHATSWMQSELGPSDGTFERFAYAGPSDIRWIVLAVAAAKCGRVMLLMSSLMPDPSKMNLLEKTGTTHYLFAETATQPTETLLVSAPHIKRIVVPSVEEWMQADTAQDFPYTKPWGVAKNDPWLIFHTSGTTSLPKPVAYSQLMMTSVAHADLFPDAGEQAQLSLFRGSRMHTPVPLNHFSGMIQAFSMVLRQSGTPVLGPPVPMTPTISAAVLKYGKVNGYTAPPLFIKHLCNNPESLELLKNLKFIMWVGAPLEQELGDLLCNHTQLSPAIGTTDTGAYFTRYNLDRSEWNYYSFRDYQGIEFRHQFSDHYELVFKRSDRAYWQQVFLLFPDLDEYHTGDVFQKHPSKDGLWRFVGRTNDLIKLSTGAGIFVSSLETTIARNEAVASALIGGVGRKLPFLLLELAKDASCDNAADLVSRELQEINKQYPTLLRIPPELVVAADPDKPFLRSNKASVARQDTFDLYKDEIELAYQRLDDKP